MKAATLTELSRKGSKRKTTADDDPLNQVKKFRKIAEIVKQEEERAQKVEKLKTLYKIKHEQDELEKQKLPGKKLPIWKKRNFGGNLIYFFFFYILMHACVFKVLMAHAAMC